MNDDINKKINQIAELLGKDTVPDNVKGLISLLANSASSAPAKPEPTPVYEERPVPKEEKLVKNDLDESLDMFRKVKTVMDRINTNHDPRINLLSAIKPFLNSNRQKKLSNCINILRMSTLARYMDEQEKKNP
ncbi:MAG: hypothetical protein N2645_13490 [Clostridia bacterium]|nr:hypothetical protein [Clostridia bacterium]